MPSLFNRNPPGSSTPAGDSDKAKPTGPAPAPVPPLPLPPELEKAAGEFKQLFLANGAQYHLEGGQGALTQEMKKQLVEKIWKMEAHDLKIELVDLVQGVKHQTMRDHFFYHSPVRLIQERIDDLKLNDPGNPDASKLAGVLQSGSIVNTDQVYLDNTAKARRLMMDTRFVSPAEKLLATEILDDKSANGNWSYKTLDDWMRKPKLEPVSFPKMSVPGVLALAINSTVQCAPIAASTARKLYATRLITKADAPAFATQFFAAALDKTHLRPGDEDKDPGRSTKENVILRYNPARLDSTMQAARTLLANGDPTHDAKAGYLRAGCLSGIKWENDPTKKERHPFPEHHILIFAARDDTLLYWDPNAGATYLTEFRKRPGFGERLGVAIGLMYYDHSNPSKPTLSTGLDFADLLAVNGSGDHTNHPQRHRYQVSELEKA